MLLCEQKRFVLSAYITGSKTENVFGRSFMLRKIIITHYWGIAKKVFKLLYNMNSLQIRQFSFKTIADFSLLAHLSPLLIKIMWSTVTKAFERSIKAPNVKCLLSKLLLIWSIYWIISCSVKWFSLMPDLFFLNML